MGSQYVVHESDGFQICLNEGSAHFNLMMKAENEIDDRHVSVWPADDGPFLRTAAAVATGRMTADEVVAMAVEMVRVAAEASWDANAVRAQAVEAIRKL